MKIVVLANGARPKAVRLARKANELLAVRYETEVHITRFSGEARQLVQCDAHLAIVAGGDGTWHECVNGVMEMQERDPDHPPPALVLLPAGSGNDFARTMGWKKDLKALMHRVSCFQATRIDVGKITSAQGQYWFANVCDAGFGAAVAHRVGRCPSWMSGNVKFGWSILRTFLVHRTSEVTVMSETHRSTAKQLMVVVANGRYFGSGICIAPDAHIDDGKLDMVIIGEVSMWQYLRYLPALRKGKKIIHPQVTYLRATALEITGEVAFESDGEAQPSPPLRIEVVPGALNVLA
ncbi:MAG: diacylglycerol kinase family lipid kinase [Flavobacteriales bacterium]|nr:diacylglycerol kinase family lipid kinase [Flavobacteriales bacterium]